MNSPVYLNKWFVRPRPNSTARMRLFIFPYAGGSPTSFHKWHIQLPEDIETCIVHYPGRGSRFNESPLTQIDQLVENIYEVIQPFLDKPFAFFGHSMGGLIAFELAHRLQANHQTLPVIFFVSGCGAPHLSIQSDPIHALSDADFIKSLRELNGTPAEILGNAELMEILLPSLRADFTAVETYRYIPYGHKFLFPITALGGSNDWHIGRERLEGWAAYTEVGFNIRYFPGDHFFIHSSTEAVLASIESELSHVQI